MDMKEVSFTGNLYFDKSLKKLSPKTEANVKNTLQKWLNIEKIQKAIPEDIYVSASNSKKKETIYINIKDADNTKYGIELFKDGNDSYLWQSFLIYIFGRYNTKPVDPIQEMLEGHKYVINRAIEILKNKF